MRRYTVALAVIALAACGTVQKGERAAANVLVSPSDEIAMGKEFKTELAKEVKLHKDPKVQNYIEDIGNKMAKRVKSPVPLHFHVIDDDKTVNAFAIPGGDIYVYTGLLKLADDDSEGARLIALNMALNGTPRDETDRYLSENFDLADREGLLDEVYAKAAP